MKTNPHLFFLGTGGSLGTPMVGCKCRTCLSTSFLNKRLRPSALLKIGEKRYLIDCGPDFRQQALNYNLDRLDGVILTHAHYDHCSGIDELRVFTFKRQYLLPCLFSTETHRHLSKTFDYIFHTDDVAQKYTTNFLSVFMSEQEGEVEFDGLEVQYCSYQQGGMKVNGLRFGNLAFITDIKQYEPSIFNFLDGIETLVISALRFTSSPLHLSVDEAVAFAKQTGAKQTWFTHIAHELEHETANAYLPANIQLAYDGLEIPFNFE